MSNSNAPMLEHILRSDLLEAIPAWIRRKALDLNHVTCVEILTLVYVNTLPADTYTRMDMLSSVERPIQSSKNYNTLAKNIQDWIRRLKLARERDTHPDPGRMLKIVMDAITPHER